MERQMFEKYKTRSITYQGERWGFGSSLWIQNEIDELSSSRGREKLWKSPKREAAFILVRSSNRGYFHRIRGYFDTTFGKLLHSALRTLVVKITRIGTYLKSREIKYKVKKISNQAYNQRYESLLRIPLVVLAFNSINQDNHSLHEVEASWINKQICSNCTKCVELVQDLGDVSSNRQKSTSISTDCFLWNLWTWGKS